MKKKIIIGLVLVLLSLVIKEAYSIDNIVIKKNISYIIKKYKKDPLNSLDIYYPKNKKNLPVLFFIHGGGWGGFDKNQFENLGLVFAKKDIVTVIPNFRLSPKVVHPVHVRDCAKAFNWTVKNIKKYGGDPNLIYICGHSSGGHLASLLAFNKGYLKKYGISTNRISGLICISGLYDLTPRAIKDKDPKIQRIIEGLIESAIGKSLKIRKNATSTTYLRNFESPVLILYSENDALLFKNQAKNLNNYLIKKNVSVQIIKIKGGNHQSMIFDIGTQKDNVSPIINRFIKFRSYD